MAKRILAINPGSTSTKIAVFEDESPQMETTLRHSNQEIEGYQRVIDQYPFRKEVILKALEDHDIKVDSLDAVVGRGGLLRPIEGGTYQVTESMVEELRLGKLREHASNLGCILAKEIADSIGKPSFIVDPVVVDELQDIARISGLPEIERVSIFHALNQKATARRAVKELGKTYEESRLIVTHLGGGISVGAHVNGQVIDVNNALDGEGPFSPERAGGLPVIDLCKICFSGQFSFTEMKQKIVGKGGIVAYLGTNDAREVEERIQAGDDQARLIYEAMAYQVAKEIGAMAAVLQGDIDAVVLTGGLAYSNMFIDWIKQRVNFLGKLMVFPGEDEMIALAQGALRVLNNEEEAKQYE